MQAHDNVKPPAQPQPQQPGERETAGAPTAKSPVDESNLQVRHKWDDFVAFLDGLGFWAGVISTVSTLAGWILAISGVGAAVSPILGLIGQIAGWVSTVASCGGALLSSLGTKFNYGDLVGCALDVIGRGIGLKRGQLRDLITGFATRRETVDAIREFDRISMGIGVNFNLLGLINSFVGMLNG
ncbi:hypothetical protein HNO83_20115 [Leifsonia sp. C5G2]|nr:hypothetical protein [Leifsonia sp. C5G2]